MKIQPQINVCLVMSTARLVIKNLRTAHHALWSQASMFTLKGQFVFKTAWMGTTKTQHCLHVSLVLMDVQLVMAQLLKTALHAMITQLMNITKSLKQLFVILSALTVSLSQADLIISANFVQFNVKHVLILLLIAQKFMLYLVLMTISTSETPTSVWAFVLMDTTRTKQQVIVNSVPLDVVCATEDL